MLSYPGPGIVCFVRARIRLQLPWVHHPVLAAGWKVFSAVWWMVVRPLGYSWPGLLAAAGVGLLVYNLVFHYFLPIGQFAYAKSSDQGGICPWPRTLLAAFDNARLERMMGQRRRPMEVIEQDFWRPIEKVRSPKGDFWMRRGGLRFDAPALLAYLQAEHEWLADSFGEHAVRLNDIVVDVGAHVGVFTRVALDRGAAQVIALEPEPVNAECFRRNFKREVAEGRVLLVEKAAWSKAGTLPFALGASNSGTSSAVVEEPGATRIKVPADTIDHILEVLEIRKVHFIKMDIEGAEREALTGAIATLKRHRPRLMLDGYHRPDDSQVLPAIIHSANAGYRFTCGPCEMNGKKVVPHAIFFE